MSEIDNLCSEFLNNIDENDAISVIKYLRENNKHKVGTYMGQLLNYKFQNNFYILQEYSICCYYHGDIEKSYDINNQILKLKNLSEYQSTCIIFNQHFCLNSVLDRYIGYNLSKVNYLKNRPKKEFPFITLTMTTCKRFDLFEKTINSILNCFEDIDMIDEFFCVDDNSSEEDRNKMKELYPFFTFYFKKFEEKGHAKSMNIIQDYILNTSCSPYYIHLEDDWKFFCKQNYISDALDVLKENINIGQCLFNKNYIEIVDDVMNVKGGEYHQTKNGTRYYIHEFADNEEKILKWMKKYGKALSSYYWPHFSFRPSLVRSTVLRELGIFNIDASHFEMEYAHKYVSKGYISAFFENIYCIHTGRLTCQKHDPTIENAYTLNNENQFVKKEEKPVFNMKTYIVNLDRRPDRWEKFVSNSKELNFLKYERFSAVDGSKIESTTQLQRIFNNNDYNMKVGMVGCFMSHVKLYIDLIESDCEAYCILEDDIEFCPDFKNKFLNVCEQLKKTNWDLFYLGHHFRNKNDKDTFYDKDKMPVIEKANVYKCFQTSFGGTIGYLITKSGAQKLLDFISESGATNCIDTLQQKSADILDVYYCSPHLIYSECYDMNANVDTDIQMNNNSLTKSLEIKIQEEIEFYKNLLNIQILNFENIIDILLNKFSEEIVIYTIDAVENINKIKIICKKKSLKFYTIENRAIFIIFSTKNIERYCHAFKINGKYSIEHCLLKN